jgi:phenolic acid decarboxylase
MKIEVMNESKDKNKKYEDYEIQNWADTLMKAEEIKNDSEKMSLIKPHLEKKMKAIKSIADLKKVASQKIKEAQEEEMED